MAIISKLMQLDAHTVSFDHSLLDTWTIVQALAAGAILYFILIILRNIFFSPIRHIAGPWKAAAR
jgi:hypothetical protein